MCESYSNARRAVDSQRKAILRARASIRLPGGLCRRGVSFLVPLRKQNATGFLRDFRNVVRGQADARQAALIGVADEPECPGQANLSWQDWNEERFRIRHEAWEDAYTGTGHCRSHLRDQIRALEPRSTVLDDLRQVIQLG